MPTSPLLSALVSQRICTYSLDVESYISRLDADSIRSSGSIVVKTTSEVCKEFIQDSGSNNLRSQVLGRILERPIYLLTTEESEEHAIYELHVDSLKPVDDLNAIEMVRQRDIEQWIRSTGGDGFLKLPPNHHFVTPSGMHTTRFLRVADLMQDLPSLDAFSYWLRPHFSRAKAVLADNRSIVPVILRTLLSLKKTNEFPFNFLPGHVAHEPVTAEKIVNQLVEQVEKGDKVLCILSAHSSGTYAKRLLEIFSESGNAAACALISMFRFRDADRSIEIPTLFELPHDVGGAGSDGSCSLCDGESKAVRIDPYHYYVRERDETGIDLKKKHFSAREFLDRYGATSGALNIHHTDPHDGRHHAFYIDVRSLLTSKEFQDRFRTTLLSIRKPDLICAPDHAAGKALAEFASNVLSLPYICNSSDCRPTNDTQKEQIEQLRAARHLLVLDDVIISGSRLEKINSALRESVDQYGAFDSVTYLVAVSRMESNRNLQELNDALTKEYKWDAKLLSVEKLLLPHWKESSTCNNIVLFL